MKRGTGHTGPVIVPEYITRIIRKIHSIESFLDALRGLFPETCPGMPKHEEGNALPHYPAIIQERNPLHDRMFPLETMELRRYADQYGLEIPGVIIHTGSYADELARSMHAPVS